MHTTFYRNMDEQPFEREPAPKLDVTVVVPTLERPKPLARALASLARQKLACADQFEVVVVDNSRMASAREQIKTMQATFPVELCYVTLPKPGVASARNLGVHMARGEWVAFLDDDEEASDHWLSSLLVTARRTDADAVFGPIAALGEEGREVGTMGRYFDRRFDLADCSDVTSLAAYLGTNNSMFHRQKAFGESPPFAVELDGIGGEDSLMLVELVERGARFGWSNAARVIEWVPTSRLQWAYVYRRKFLSGQIRTFAQRLRHPPRWGKVATWMAVGAVQATVCALAAVVSYPAAPDRSRRLKATAWGGLGKVFWMTRFRPRLYGEGHVS